MWWNLPMHGMSVPQWAVYTEGSVSSGSMFSDLYYTSSINVDLPWISKFGSFRVATIDRF